METLILVRMVTGLLICRLLALDVVFVDKVLQMNKTGHVLQRLHALAGFGLRVFPATVSIRFHMGGLYIYIYDRKLVSFQNLFFKNSCVSLLNSLIIYPP